MSDERAGKEQSGVGASAAESRGNWPGWIGSHQIHATSVAGSDETSNEPDVSVGASDAAFVGRDSMRLAYADPPYPGQSKRHYGDHPDYAGEVDHRELIERLREYDGWALSTSMVSLHAVLPLCPADALVAVWHVTDSGHPGHRNFAWWFAWEPVIVVPARPAPDVRNVLACSCHAGEWRSYRQPGYVVGRKPQAFSHWVFSLLGARPEDLFADLFPGSGAVTRAWETWRSQPTLSLPPTTHRRRARFSGDHPSLIDQQNDKIAADNGW